MTDFPPDLEALVADAVAGDLSTEDARRLDALMADDPSIAALVEEQRSVVSSLSAGHEPMSELERRRMRMQVLRAVEAPKVAPWLRWTVSAAAAVFVVVVGAFALLSGGGDDATFGDISADLGDPEATSVAEAERAEEDGDDALDEAALAPTSVDADTAADAGEAGADGALAQEVFPACPGDVEELADGVDGWESLDEATAAFENDPWVLVDDGEPLVAAFDDAAVFTWFDDAGMVQQVELRLEGDGWQTTRRVVCAR